MRRPIPSPVSLVLIFLAVAAGVVHGALRSPAPLPTSPVAPVTPPGPPLVPPPNPVDPTTTSENPEALLAEARHLAAGADFEGARSRAARAAHAAAAQKRMETAAGADLLAARYEVLVALTGAITPPSTTEAPKAVRLADGSLRLGRPTVRSPHEIRLIGPDGTETTIPLRDAEEVVPAETEAWESACRGVLEARRRSAGKLFAPLARYQDATIAVRQGRGDAAEGLIEEALAGEGTAFLLSTFATGDPERLLRRWRLATGMGPIAGGAPPTDGPDPAAPPPPPDVEPPPVPPASTSGLPPELVSDPRYHLAEKMAQEGLALYRQSIGPGPEALEALRTARLRFEKALDLLDDLANDHPRVTELDTKRERLQTLLYDCVKRDRL